MTTLITLLHSENRSKVLTVLGSLIVLLATYTGTLPAPLNNHKDWIELASYLVIGLNLVHIDPKRELQ